MNNNESIEEIFFKYLSKFKYNEEQLNYSIVSGHTRALQSLSDIGNSGTGIFDFSKRQMIFYSSNFGALLGYKPSDYQETGQQFFASRIHPDDALKCSISGVSVLKLYSYFSSDEKLNHKVIREYRMLNAENEYIRLIEQYQVLELDEQGQIWLMLNIVDISPNQEPFKECTSQLLNFKTGKIISMEVATKQNRNILMIDKTTTSSNTRVS